MAKAATRVRRSERKNITSGVALPIEGLREVSVDLLELPTWAGVEQPLFVYELEGWQPSAWVARDWAVVDMDEDVGSLLDRLARTPDVALVSSDPGIQRGSTVFGSDVIGPIVRGPERLDIRVELAAPGLLVLNEAPSAGWTAEVNGQPAEILKVNLIGRGVALPAGAHQISMRFGPPRLAAGVAVSLVATGLLVPLLAAGLWSDRR